MIYLLDSNTIIDYLAGILPAPAMGAMSNIVNNGFFISIITRIETLSYQSGDAKVDANTLSFVNMASAFDLSPDIVKKTIDFRKLKRKLKTPDAIIASTAVVHNLILLTRNLSDFSNLPGLTVVNPYNL